MNKNIILLFGCMMSIPYMVTTLIIFFGAYLHGGTTLVNINLYGEGFIEMVGTCAFIPFMLIFYVHTIKDFRCKIQDENRSVVKQ